jgi:FkbM family methyltransferase
LSAKFGIHRFPGFNRVFIALYPVYKRYFEAGPVNQLREFVPSGSLVIDVGANVGFFSARFADWVGDDGKVISIEPEDQNYNSLISALKRAGLLGRVQPLKSVATAEPGATFLEINPLHPADHKLSRNGVGVPVTAVTLDGLMDGLMQEQCPLLLALVKIDVQGAEMLVLQGMTGILKNAGPALFIELCEHGLSKFGASVSAVLNLLAKNGYEAHWLTGAGRKRASRSEIHARIARAEYVDVLFLRTQRPVSLSNIPPR